jgi:hypothetical protein
MRTRSDGVEAAVAIRGDADEPEQVPYERERELREFASATVKRRVRTHEIGSIRAKLRASAAGHLSQAAAQLGGRRADERLPDSDWASFRKAVNSAIGELDQIDRLGDFEHVAVVSEQSPYDAGSPHSWVRDVLAHSDETRTWLSPRSDGESDMSVAAVAERLRRHEADVVSALRRGTEYGKRVQRMLSETHRQEDAQLHKRLAGEQLRALTRGESRAFQTGGGATASSAGGGGAAFVTPAILIDEVWAPYRSPHRAFVDQCNSSVPLPAWGLQAYVPVVTTGTSVTTQTEEGSVSEGDPVTNYTSSTVVTKAGQITVSQQFLDRAGPGIAGDGVLFQQLRQQLNAQIDAYAIGQALAGAQSVVNNASFTVTNTSGGVGGFFSDLKKAKNLLRDTAGVRLQASHVFAAGDFVNHIAAYANTQGGPMFSPWFAGDLQPTRAQGDPQAEGYSGYVVSGCALVDDDNIGQIGTTTQLQIIVTNPGQAILQLEGAPIPYCYPPTVAQRLEAVLGLRAYLATVVRFKEGVATIFGKAYEASTFA